MLGYSTRMEVHALIAQHEVSLHYTPEDLEVDSLSPPPWLVVHESVPQLLTLSNQLDAGEREAIGFPLLLRAPVLIIDEAVGRREAQRVGLRVIGTLVILRDAHQERLLDLKSEIERLQSTSFHMPAKTLAELLRAV